MNILSILVPILLLLTPSQSTCLRTSNTCQCSKTAPTSSCPRLTGPGTCTLDVCALEYNCDCSGYEFCFTSLCQKATALEEIIPGIPFKCKYAQKQCLAPVDVLDSIEAAQNAAAETAKGNDEVLQAEKVALEEWQILQEKKKQAITVLKRVSDAALDEIETERIEGDAEELELAVEVAGGISQRATQQGRLSMKVQREVRKWKRNAFMLDRELQKVKERNEDRTGVDVLEKKRKEAARQAATRAKQGVAIRQTSLEVREEAREVGVIGRSAFNRCMQKSHQALEKALLQRYEAQT